MATQEHTHSIYPQISIETNKKPNRLYAFPVIGIIVKLIMLIPVFIEGIFLGIAFIVFWILNSFVILFTRKYWDTAYDFFLGIMRFSTKIYTFILGLTDKYPGFDLADNGQFELKIDCPKHPNRWFAVPLVGLLVRFILLIPFDIFARILQNGSWLAMIGTWFTITIQNKFPQSLYEFEYDTVRVHLSAFSYMTGLSDSYPGFSISMKHQAVKIFLLIAGTILLFWNGWHFPFNRRVVPHRYRYQNYQNQFHPINQPTTLPEQERMQNLGS